MKLFEVLLAAGAGWAARSLRSDREAEEEEKDRARWVDRARDAALRVEELTGQDYDWGEE